MFKKILNSTGKLAGTALTVFVIFLVVKEISQYSISEIITAFSEIPLKNLLFASIVTFVDYLIIAAVDNLGFVWLGYRDLSLKRFILAAAGNAIWCNAGVLAGSTAKFRLYRSHGLDTIDIASLVTFTSVTYFLGLFFLGGLIYLIEPFQLPSFISTDLISGTTGILGIVLLSLVAGYFLICILPGWKSIKTGSRNISLPSPQIAVFQVILASMDWLLASAVLMILVPDSFGLSAVQVIKTFVTAQIAVLVSQVPGGIGIFEGMVLLMLPEKVSASQGFATVLAFRTVFSIIPLLLSSSFFGIHELQNNVKINNEDIM